jgi:hypothetical protein
MSIIGKTMCFIYHMMELVDGERIRGLVLVPYRKAEEIKLVCCELIANDTHGMYRRRIHYTYRHTIGSGHYSPAMVVRCWKDTRDIFS